MTFAPSSLLADASPQSGVFDDSSGGCLSTSALPGFSPGDSLMGPESPVLAEGFSTPFLRLPYIYILKKRLPYSINSLMGNAMGLIPKGLSLLTMHARLSSE